MSMSCPPSLLVSGWTIPHIRVHRGPPQAPKINSNMPNLTKFAFVRAQIEYLAGGGPLWAQMYVTVHLDTNKEGGHHIDIL